MTLIRENKRKTLAKAGDKRYASPVDNRPVRNAQLENKLIGFSVRKHPGNALDCCGGCMQPTDFLWSFFCLDRSKDPEFVVH